MKLITAIIQEDKLDEVREALIAAEIGRIARQLGYNSLAHFSGQFRRFAHCAPSVYRQQLRAVAAAAAEVAATSKAAALNDAS